jgi:hypothetical protein
MITSTTKGSTKGGLLNRLMRRGMGTGQALFNLGIEPGIPWVRPWKEILATGAQTTWLHQLLNSNYYALTFK